MGLLSIKQTLDNSTKVFHKWHELFYQYGKKGPVN